MWKFLIFALFLISIQLINAEENETTTTIPDNEESDDNSTTVIGDMILEQDQYDYLFSPNESTRLALGFPFATWPNSTVIYSIDKSLDEKSKEIFMKAIDYIKNVSCVRFQEKDKKSKNFVLVKKGNACSSKVGYRKKGAQPLVIDGSLCTLGSVVHELLHALSFLHMHTANNRDDFVEIKWNNIRDDAKKNFKSFSSHVTMLGTEYDYNSIMHYSANAFAKDKNSPTIIAKNPEKAKQMGQRKEMSDGDIERLNRMYECSEFISLNSKSLENSSEKILNSDEINSNNTTANESTEETPSTTTISIENNSTTESTLNATSMDDDSDDMVLTKDQIDTLYSFTGAKRNGLKSAFHHWPNAVVPLEIDPTFKQDLVPVIHEAMSYISNRSCVRFVKRETTHENYIYVTRGPGCSSEVGMRRTGRQMMNINENGLCSRGKVIHELLHALGFLHMHTANDRDNYLKVNWDNIKDSAKFNFKQFVAHVSMFSTPYDYNSIMHYSSKAFAKNKNQPTLIALQTAEQMGQREGMSHGDILRLNRMYKCGDEYMKPPQTTTENTTNVEVNVNRTGKSNEPKSLLGILIFSSRG